MRNTIIAALMYVSVTFLASCGVGIGLYPGYDEDYFYPDYGLYDDWDDMGFGLGYSDFGFSPGFDFGFY